MSECSTPKSRRLTSYNRPPHGTAALGTRHAKLRPYHGVPFRTAHSALIFAARITLAHFSVSSASSLPKSADEPRSAVLPRSASLAIILGSARKLLVSLLSFSTISAGVFLGAPRPVSKPVS